MQFRIAILGVLFCLAAQAANVPGQSAQTSKTAPQAQQFLTGCVAQQAGQFVLLDDQMLRITSLQVAGTDQDTFAKYLGHKVQVTGTRASGQKGTFKVTGIKQIADNCSQAK